MRKNSFCVKLIIKWIKMIQKSQCIMHSLKFILHTLAGDSSIIRNRFLTHGRGGGIAPLSSSSSQGAVCFAPQCRKVFRNWMEGETTRKPKRANQALSDNDQRCESFTWCWSLSIMYCDAVKKIHYINEIYSNALQYTLVVAECPIKC